MTIDIAIVRSYLVLAPSSTMIPLTIQSIPRKTNGKAMSGSYSECGDDCCPGSQSYRLFSGVVTCEQFSCAVEDEPGSENEAQDRDGEGCEAGFFHNSVPCGVSY